MIVHFITGSRLLPKRLTTRRVHVHYHTETMTRNSPSLEQEIKKCLLEMNPADAVEIGVADGASVLVASRRGSASPSLIEST